MYLMIEVRELLTKTLLFGGMRAICSIELVIEAKTAREVIRVFVFAMLQGTATFLVIFSISAFIKLDC